MPSYSPNRSPTNFSAPDTLITGANGYIGSHLVTSFGKSAVTWDLAGPVDINKCISAKPDFKLDTVTTVIHLADLRLSKLHAENIQSNLNVHKRFFDTLKTLPRLKRVVFASSCSVYGVNSELIEETSETNPTSAYAESKLETENLLRQSGLPYVILRFATAFGLSPNMRGDLLINNLAHATALKQTMTLFDLNARRPYVHCRDFASALRMAQKLPIGQIFNVASFNLSKNELLMRIRKCSPQIPIVNFSNVRDSRDYFVSSKRIQDLGFSSTVDLETGFLEMLNSFNGPSPDIVLQK